MRLCYIILAHNNLRFLSKQIQLLSGENIGFIIHIDKKCTEECDFLNGIPNVTVLSQRFDVHWGDFSIVNTVIEAAKKALQDNIDYEYFILLSGQCAPVKSSEYIKHYIESKEFANFVSAFPIPSKECNWNDGGRQRINGYAVRLSPRSIASIIPRSLRWSNIRQVIKSFKRGNFKSFYRALTIFLFRAKQTLPKNYQFYGGEFWWRMNRTSLETVIDGFEANLEFQNRMKRIVIPDEVTFNTLLLNSDSNNFVTSNLSKIKWNHKSSPEFYRLPEDKSIIKECVDDKNILFIRKVKDLDVLEFIKKLIS